MRGDDTIVKQTSRGYRKKKGNIIWFYKIGNRPSFVEARLQSPLEKKRRRRLDEV